MRGVWDEEAVEGVDEGDEILLSKRLEIDALRAGD